MRTPLSLKIATILLFFSVPFCLSQSSSVDPALLAKAAAGDPAAQVAVGDQYLAGIGAEQDCKLAAEWFLKAAMQADTRGEIRLAEFYRDGSKQCPRDRVQSAIWYKKAAEQGDVAAQGTLGVLYSLGQGVAQNYVEAYFWFDLAASVASPRQAQYAANRQMAGVHVTTEELEGIQARLAQWKKSHPTPGSR